MAEPLTSNPSLVDDLRLHASFRKSFPQEYRMVLAAADEIERLTRELAGTKDELYSVDKAAKELGAERARLRADLHASDLDANARCQENLRLRTALELSAETCENCYQHAREALAYPTSPSAVGDQPKDRPADSAIDSLGLVKLPLPSPPDETSALPADGTVDGDGTWWDGKWHPRPPDCPHGFNSFCKICGPLNR